MTAFQNFTAHNALLLDTTTFNSATLTLIAPTPLASVALIVTTSGGPTSASVSLNFSDSTTSQYLIVAGEGIGNDWFQPTLPSPSRWEAALQRDRRRWSSRLPVR